MPAAPEQEPTPVLSPDDLFRRRGLIAGWVIAWPFFVMTLMAGTIAVVFQWMQRPQLVLFTIGLYLCMGFFAHAYSIAWQTGAYVRQMLAMLAVVIILTGLIFLHLDDGSARWVYRGHERVLRPAQPLLRVAVALDVVAILVIVSHGLGLGFGNRFFVRESGSRVSGTYVKELLDDGRRLLLGEDEPTAADDTTPPDDTTADATTTDDTTADAEVLQHNAQADAAPGATPLVDADTGAPHDADDGNTAPPSTLVS